MKLYKAVLFFILLGTQFLLSSCSINPATGTPDLVFMSESEEIAKGKELNDKLIKSTPLYQDKQLLAYIDKVGQKVAKHSDRPGLTYHFNIIDSPDINAFALPGGYIYVNRGLLAYLSSEAQLAAVLAHEIGHVAARHVVRQDVARKGASVLSVLSVLTTGSFVVGDAASLWSTAAVQGYGREMELEADSLGAQYLYNSNYSPNAMVETISILKNQEQFSRYRAKEEGKKPVSYHGVFATHPRNDVRLKEVIAKAGKLSQKANYVANEQQYRQHTEGLVYGIDFDVAPRRKPVEKNRYIHRKLGFSILFPKHWQIKKTRQAIIGKPDDDSAQLSLNVAMRVRGMSPGDYLRKVSNVKMLSQSEDFSQNGLIGHTGILLAKKEGKENQRIAVIYQGSKAYLLRGSVTKPKKNIDYDALFLASIHSFRPERIQRRKPKSKRIHYVKANSRTNMKLLAKQLNIGLYAEQQLRLINGLYPRGKPKVGQWLKIIK